VSLARTQERIAREVRALAETVVVNESTPTPIPALTPKYKPHHSQTGISGGGLLAYRSAAMAGAPIMAIANKEAAIGFFIVSSDPQLKLGSD
jgi:hypothetical protein